MDITPLAEYRCVCNRLLFRGVVLSARIQVKCKRCGSLVPFGPSDPEDELFHYGFIADNSGAITEVSDTAPPILGYSRQELLAMNIRDLETYQKSQETARSVPIKTPVAFDQIHRTKSGTQLNVRTRIDTLYNNNHSLYIYLFDALPTKKVVFNDRAQREGVKEIRCIAEVDRHGTCIYVSANLHECLQREVLDLVGNDFFKIFIPEKRHTYRTWFNEMAQERVAYSMLAQVETCASGEESCTMLIHCTPTYRDDGCLRGYSFLFERIN